MWMCAITSASASSARRIPILPRPLTATEPTDRPIRTPPDKPVAVRPVGGTPGWDRMCAAIADAVPWWEPGTVTAYHAQSFGYVVGEVVRRATGRRISEVLRAEVAEPLGAATTPPSTASPRWPSRRCRADRSTAWAWPAGQVGPTGHRLAEGPCPGSGTGAPSGGRDGHRDDPSGSASRPGPP
ncbi:serine hydrolase domain-containing protein [Microtetraspora sp. NBRC 13810]|uniref:serine hydrolase domain-containing protein n=1 Tax=Microtetraspora sp. NBRC 13810 TaxID=3030990 RepID=UPI00332B3456